MLNKENYANGQKMYELNGNILTHFYKSGKLKAEGIFKNEQMQGEWKFYRETAQLQQIGNLLDNHKHGAWIRFDKNNEIEYDEIFEHNKIVKRSK